MSLRTTIDRTLPTPLRRAKAHLGRWARHTAGRFVSVAESPLLLLGNQKSGTTVIAAALARCINRPVTLDLRDLRAETLHRVHRHDIPIDTLVQQHRLAFSRPVIKEPNLTFLYDELAQRFPGARFGLILRDPRDNIRSLLNGYRLPGHVPDLTPAQRADLHPLLDAIVYSPQLDLDGTTHIERLAERWNRAADVYLDHPDAVTLLRYEDFCEDKVAHTERMACALGYEPQGDVREVVQQQHQRRGNRSVPWDTFFGTDNLARIEARCEARMNALGYACPSNRSASLS